MPQLLSWHQWQLRWYQNRTGSAWGGNATRSLFLRYDITEELLKLNLTYRHTPQLHCHFKHLFCKVTIIYNMMLKHPWPGRFYHDKKGNDILETKDWFPHTYFIWLLILLSGSCELNSFFKKVRLFQGSY